jgi:hypothetical protein
MSTVLTRPSAAQAELTTLKAQARALLDTIAADGRSQTPTAEEQTKLSALLEKATQLQRRIAQETGDQALFAQLDALLEGAHDGPPPPPASPMRPGLSLGAQFIKSEAYAWLKASKASRPQAWYSPSAEWRPSSRRWPRRQARRRGEEKCRRGRLRRVYV